MLRVFTAGESHGKCLIGIIEGCPANFDIDIEEINKDLARRQKGYGRGGRMLIETDRVNPIWSKGWKNLRQSNFIYDCK